MRPREIRQLVKAAELRKDPGLAKVCIEMMDAYSRFPAEIVAGSVPATFHPGYAPDKRPYGDPVRSKRNDSRHWRNLRARCEDLLEDVSTLYEIEQRAIAAFALAGQSTPVVKTRYEHGRWVASCGGFTAPRSSATRYGARVRALSLLSRLLTAGDDPGFVG